MISTRGRYALRVMLELAERKEEGYVPMKEIALQQGLSLKYLERILPPLTRGGLIEGVRGKEGGYRLTRSPECCTVGEILRLTEGEMAPVTCLESGAEPCCRHGECRTQAMWKGYYELTNAYFDGITLADLLTPKDSPN